jgi:Na+-transporting methylmalonyl-CoA/oxaloacetate decarboxylase gamma subunit
MDFLTQLLAAGGPVSIGIACIFLLLVLAIKIIWENGKEERKARIESEVRNAEKYENVVKQMFEVVNTNTKAVSTNTEVTRELNTNMRELRLAQSSQ